MSAEVEFVDTDTGEVIPACSAQEARDLTDQIKTAVDTTWHLVKRAYSERAWEALGYASWDDYCTREFGAQRLRLPREERREVVGSLREAGLSMRAIAAATGNGYGTVRRDLSAGEPSGSPDPPRNGEWHDGPPPEPEPAPEPQPVQGRDGKTYKPSKPRSKPKPTSEPDAEEIERQRQEADRQARLDHLYRALEYLATHPVSPDAAASEVPDEMSYRIDDHLDSAMTWLSRFADAWNSERRPHTDSTS